jgi:hypothetical protein
MGIDGELNGEENHEATEQANDKQHPAKNIQSITASAIRVAELHDQAYRDRGQHSVRNGGKEIR